MFNSKSEDYVRNQVMPESQICNVSSNPRGPLPIFSRDHASRFAEGRDATTTSMLPVFTPICKLLKLAFLGQISLLKQDFVAICRFFYFGARINKNLWRPPS
jgi:hypothetical protein